MITAGAQVVLKPLVHRLHAEAEAVSPANPASAEAV